MKGFFYKNFLKRFLFLFPADLVHAFFLRFGKIVGKSSFVKKQFEKFWRYDNSGLEQSLHGLDFRNPIGLSAGFDYNADLVDLLPSIGFGFHAIGTLTFEAYAGNKPPRLDRLPRSKSLLVNKGFKNRGVEQVLIGVGPRDGRAIRGLSIGSTNKPYPDFNAMIGDLFEGFSMAETFDNFDYYELNISCPNLINIQKLDDRLTSPSGLMKALTKLAGLNIRRPVFIKMPLEQTEAEIKKLIDTANDFPFVKGLIFSNLAKDRTNPLFDKEEVSRVGAGNFSGKPVEKKSNELLEYAYRNYRHRFTLIGVGGVFSAEDAYKKILLGASLVQLITGMIFMGPQLIGQINRGLVKLLNKDGYQNIKEAIGSAVV